MVVLNRIYTRTGDQGTTALAAGGRRPKHDLRIEAFGTVDETNACLGMVRLHTAGHEIDPMLGRIQNDLFDLGADLATVETDKPLPYEPLRIAQAQVDRLEREIDQLNESLFSRAAPPRRPPFTSLARFAGGPSAGWWSSPRGRTRRCRPRR